MLCNECVRFEQKLAFHTAPALLGIKPANLVSLSAAEFNIRENADIFNARAASKGLKIKVLCECRKKILIFLYNEAMLKKQLSENERSRVLAEFGYGRGLSLELKLKMLAERISAQNDFPHEIGLFLGYPVEDVVGFIENGGGNFKLCGYWKVYGSEEQARRTFENYNKCRKYLCNKLSQGFDIYQALRIS